MSIELVEANLVNILVAESIDIRVLHITYIICSYKYSELCSPLQVAERSDYWLKSRFVRVKF